MIVIAFALALQPFADDVRLNPNTRYLTCVLRNAGVGSAEHKQANSEARSGRFRHAKAACAMERERAAAYADRIQAVFGSPDQKEARLPPSAELMNQMDQMLLEFVLDPALMENTKFGTPVID